MSLDNEWPFGVMCADCDTVLDPSSSDVERQPWALLETEHRTDPWEEMPDETRVFRVVCMTCWRKEVAA